MLSLFSTHARVKNGSYVLDMGFTWEVWFINSKSQEKTDCMILVCFQNCTDSKAKVGLKLKGIALYDVIPSTLILGAYLNMEPKREYGKFRVHFSHQIRYGRRYEFGSKKHF